MRKNHLSLFFERNRIISIIVDFLFFYFFFQNKQIIGTL